MLTLNNKDLEKAGKAPCRVREGDGIFDRLCYIR